MQKTAMREMIWKKVGVEAFLKTVSVGAEVTTGGRLFQRRLTAALETHDRRQWTAVYV